MSLAEIEQKVIELSDADRRQFALWFYENEGKILDDGVSAEVDEISPEVMEELVRRRRELDSGNVKLFSVEEVLERMKEAVDEVRCSVH